MYVCNKKIEREKEKNGESNVEQRWRQIEKENKRTILTIVQRIFYSK